MTESMPKEDTHPQLADQYQPGKTEPLGDCKPNTSTRRKIFKHAGKGILAGVSSYTFGRSAAGGFWIPNYGADRGKPVLNSIKTRIPFIIDDRSPVDAVY